MSGMHDGVSKLWIVRREGGLQVSGQKDELEAIDHLIRCALVRGTADRDAIERTVNRALRHMEETKFYCAGENCPGLAYSASDKAHPITCR